MEFVYPCPDHIFPFCTDENPFGISYKSATKGYAAFPKTANIGCLVTAPGPAWYYMQIDHPGDLLIYIEQTSMFFKLDVDFACWGPFEAKSKKEFLDRLCASYYKLNVDSHPNHRPKDGNHHGDTGGYPFDNLVDCSFDPAVPSLCFRMFLADFSSFPAELQNARTILSTARCVFSGVLKAVRRR